MQKFLLMVALLLMAGCGKGAAPTAHLAGNVTIGGAPIPSDASAALSFTPSGSGKAVSVPITGGHYDSPNTPVGPISVNFYISRRTGPEKISERTGEKYQDIVNLVPPEHAAGETISVSGDNLSQNFQL